MNMTATIDTSSSPSAKRIEELGQIIMAYSDVTEKLQKSHDELKQTVQRLRSELSEKNRMLERKNRLAAVGEMAAGMAHEIRNPLGGIQLYASLLLKDLTDRPDCCELVRKIADGVKRLEALVSQVLQFTREIRAVVVETDLHKLIEQTAELVRPQLAYKEVSLVVDCPSPMIVRIDPLLIGQSLLNLLLNAVHAMSGGGEILVQASAPHGGTGAKQVHLIVQDEGPGVPTGILDRIFDPFFTTRAEGTGLGLAIVHRVVEAHEGTITATNVDGGGARFEIRI